MNTRKLMAVAAMCVATVSSPSLAADRTITSDYTLSADTTADALVDGHLVASKDNAQ